MVISGESLHVIPAGLGFGALSLLGLFEVQFVGIFMAF